MTKIITERGLKEAIKNNTFIINGKLKNAEGVKYDFCMSSLVLKSDYPKPIDVNKLSESEKGKIAVEPGEVVFVLTEEILNLPNNIKANLSPKRKLSHDGIIILGGFCVDPLYNGRILIGLYNCSSEPYPLWPGKKLIAALFYKLENDEIDEFRKPEGIMDEFPRELLNSMKKFKSISLQQLMEEIKDLKISFDNLKKDYKDKEEWFEKFQQNLDKQEKRINEIINLIEKESSDRIMADKDIEKEQKELIKKVYFVAGSVAIGGSLIIAFLIQLIQRILD